MKSKTGIIQDANGNASSGRIIGLSVVFMAIFAYLSCYVFAFIHPDMALGILGVASGGFITVTTPTFMFLYNQKKTEVSTQKPE